MTHHAGIGSLIALTFLCAVFLAGIYLGAVVTLRNADALRGMHETSGGAVAYGSEAR